MPTFASEPRLGSLLSVGCVVALSVSVVVTEFAGEGFEDKAVEVEVKDVEVEDKDVEVEDKDVEVEDKDDEVEDKEIELEVKEIELGASEAEFDCPEMLEIEILFN